MRTQYRKTNETILIDCLSILKLHCFMIGISRCRKNCNQGRQERYKAGEEKDALQLGAQEGQEVKPGISWG